MRQAFIEKQYLLKSTRIIAEQMVQVYSNLNQSNWKCCHRWKNLKELRKKPNYSNGVSWSHNIATERLNV